MRNFLLTRTSFLDLCRGDHFPWLCSNQVTHAQVWYGVLGPGRLCMAPRQPHTTADTNPPSGRTVCDLWDCATALANLAFSSWGPNLTLHLIFLKCCGAETPGLFPSLRFVQIFSALARTRRRGYRSIIPASSWPRDSRGFQPSLPSQVFFQDDETNISPIHLPQEGLFSREDWAVDVKRNNFTQACALILWVYTIFSLLLRGGCFGILYLARWWEFLEDPSFPFLGYLHPQVLLHKAVGYYGRKEGGQLGTEGLGGVKKVWWGPDPSLTPAGLAPSTLSSSPCQHTVPAPCSVHASQDCAPPALHPFSSTFTDTGSYFLHMNKYLQSFLKYWAACWIAKETLANLLGRWERTLSFPRGNGGLNQPQAPNVT